MQCPKCGSTNVSVQVVNETTTKLVNKHHGILWWIFIGWWWLAVKWLVFTLPALLVKMFKPKDKKLKQKHAKVSMAVCQNCGHTWQVSRTKK